MKKILFIICLFASIGLLAQTPTSIQATKTTIKSTFAMTSVTGSDTSFVLTFPMENLIKGYSIQIALTDTVETGGLGAFLYWSLDGSNYIQLGDSLAFAVSTYPLSKGWTGSVFPYTFAKIKVKKNGATDGDIKLLTRFDY